MSKNHFKNFRKDIFIIYTTPILSGIIIKIFFLVQVLKSLQEDPGPQLVEETERLRPNIITKYDFMVRLFAFYLSVSRFILVMKILVLSNVFV